MTSLTDIVPTSEVVHGVTVRGISFKAVADLLGRFPELVSILSGNAPSSIGGDAVAGVIAAGCGYAGVASEEAAAGNLPADIQLDLLGAVVRLTIGKNGVGPFVQKILALGGTTNGPEQTQKKYRLKRFVRQPSGSSIAAGDLN